MERIVESPIDQRKIFRILGSFGDKKHHKTIELEDKYLVKCVCIGSNGTCKVGVLYDFEKKRYLKVLTGEPVSNEAPEPEEEKEEDQVTLDELTNLPAVIDNVADTQEVVSPNEDSPEEEKEEEEIPELNIDLDAARLKYPGVFYNDSEKVLIAEDSFFDELHCYAEFKHEFSHIYGIRTSCCDDGHLVVDKNSLVCSSCGTITPNSGWVKPKPSITF